jgi:hypothetical protein
MTSAPVHGPLADHLLTPELAGHPVIRSYEPGDDWYWCYVDQLVFELEGAPLASSQP